MQARLGEGFFCLFFNKENFYSIRLVPGSSPGQPIMIIILKSDEILYYIYGNFSSDFYFLIHFKFSKKNPDESR